MPVIVVKVGEEELSKDMILDQIESNLASLGELYAEYVKIHNVQYATFLELSEDHRRESTIVDINKWNEWLNDAQLQAVHTKIDSTKERLKALSEALVQVDKKS